MRVGIAQVNSTLGDFKKNADRILKAVHSAADKRCKLVIFPECVLFGYHPFDLLEHKEFVRNQLKYKEYLEKRMPEGISALVGMFTFNKSPLGRPYYNSVALMAKGKKTRFFHKQLLPTGDVFDEARFIQQGKLENNYFSIGQHRFFLTICEDIWAWPQNKKSLYQENPISKVKRRPVDLVINMSASPYFLGKMQLRNDVTRQTAKYFRAPLAYVNLVGAQDEIIYDGASFVIRPDGKKILRCYAFQEDLNVFDLESQNPWHQAQDLNRVEELRRALVLGISDFCKKVGLARIHLGISGGVDSALVAALAVDALGPKNVVGVAMPGPYSSKLSLVLARELCNNLDIELKVVPIDPIYRNMIKLLTKNLQIKRFGTTHENLQARLRGLTLMVYANENNSLLLSTSNKSEMATGYSTLYGDMCGGLAPIGDLTKKQVYDLCHYYNEQHEVIPNKIIKRPPSAELRPNQRDQDSLPPYPVLDRAVEKLVERESLPKTKVEKWLFEKLLRTEFKRWQAPPILKVTSHSFGRGRRFPIALK